MRAMIRFGKQPRLRFISHLDLPRFFQRALNRTGLPIAWTQGFNPHPIMSFGSALALGWINVVIGEGLYDRAFVEGSCTGFDELPARAAEYPPERVAALCGIDAELVRETARVYARAQAAIIPWGVVGDMQRNSTSLLQAQCILRALCGFVNKSESVCGPALGAVGNA